MSRMTTHVLDTAQGRPAAGLRVVLDLPPIEYSSEMAVRKVSGLQELFEALDRQSCIADDTTTMV